MRPFGGRVILCGVKLERGTLGPFGVLEGGSGPPLVFLGGLSPEQGVDAAGTARMNDSLLRPFARGRRVVFVNRRAGLPRGMTMTELAGEHAAAIRARFGGPVDLAGISTGGSIAQQLAADHPELVRRLVLLSTACRLGPLGKAMQRRVAARVRRGAQRQALAVLMSSVVPPRRGQTAAGALAWLAGPRLLAGGDDLSDLATTIDAEDAFDLALCPHPIRAPTLILVGADDRFYTRELFAETAALIEGSRLRVFDGRGHITVTMHPEWGGEIERFLG